jgi:hypothetical protein
MRLVIHIVLASGRLLTERILRIELNWRLNQGTFLLTIDEVWTRVMRNSDFTEEQL